MNIIKKLRIIYPKSQWEYNPSINQWHSNKNERVYWVRADADFDVQYNVLYYYDNNNSKRSLATKIIKYKSGKIEEIIYWHII